MADKLRISDNLSLPADAVTQTFAILGIRGSGKTNTGVVLMEEMLTIGQQCVALDPTNAWYGIRSSRNGKSAGFKVYVFGGPNGDLPLEGTHGNIMADFVVETGASVIFSLRHLSMNDQRRFAMEFGERLHFLKGKPENRTPLCLFLDEADEFVPQRIPHGYERMFGAYDRLVRRDRNCGLGVVLISQRPQVINKDTLSQIETLICHRLLHKLDRKSVKEAWVEGHDIHGKADEFFDGLASLAKGDTWVWSPEWLDIFKRVHIRQRSTFDSSATPKAGEKAKVAHQLAEVDLDKLKERLSSTIEKAKQDDPRELRRQIGELHKQLASLEKAKGTAAKEKVVVREVKVDRPFLPKEIVRSIEATVKAVKGSLAAAYKMEQELDGARRSVKDSFVHSKERQLTESTLINELKRPSVIAAKVASLPVRSNGSGSGTSLPPGERAVMIAVGQFGSVEREQLTVLTGYKRSSRDAYISRLAARGFIEIQGRTLMPTQSGIDSLGGDYEPLPTGSALYEHWRNRLPEGELKILDILVKQGSTVARSALDDLTEYKRSSRDAYLSRLMAKRLIEVPQSGMVKAADALFD